MPVRQPISTQSAEGSAGLGELSPTNPINSWADINLTAHTPQLFAVTNIQAIFHNLGI